MGTYWDRDLPGKRDGFDSETRWFDGISKGHAGMGKPGNLGKPINLGFDPHPT